MSVGSGWSGNWWIPHSQKSKKIFCNGGDSHHGDFALGDATLGEDSLYCFTYMTFVLTVGG